MYIFVLTIHVVVSILLVVIVLLQVGRGQGMLGFLGGGTAESLFGSRSADVLTKSTAVIAALFAITSLSLAYISARRGSSVMIGHHRTAPGNIVHQKAIPGAGTIPENKLIQKGTGFLQRAAQKLANKLPILTKEGLEAKKSAAPASSTKSNITYSANGNKIVDALKYNSKGKLTGHTKITYDRLGKEIEKKELPLEEKSIPAKPLETTNKH